MNAVSLEGRLATAPKTQEIARKDGSGTEHKTEFLLAVSKRKRDAEPDWIWVQCWGRLAEVVAEHCVKGMRVTVRGRVTGRFIESGEHSTKGRLRIGVTAEEVAFGQRPKAATQEAPKGGRR